MHMLDIKPMKEDQAGEAGLMAGEALTGEIKKYVGEKDFPVIRQQLFHIIKDKLKIKNDTYKAMFWDTLIMVLFEKYPVLSNMGLTNSYQSVLKYMQVLRTQ
jgi:hypothetical protein